MTRKHFTFEDEIWLLEQGEYEKSRYVLNMRTIEFYNELIEGCVKGLIRHIEDMDDIQDFIKNPYLGIKSKAYWSERWLQINKQCADDIDRIVQYRNKIREVRSNY